MFVVMGMEMDSIPSRSIYVDCMFVQEHGSVLG